MSLLEKMPELRERSDRYADLEFHNLVPYVLPGTAWDIAYLMSAYPKMLEALSCFQPGDAMKLSLLIYGLEKTSGGVPSDSAIIVMLQRLQKAAEILEAP